MKKILNQTKDILPPSQSNLIEILPVMSEEEKKILKILLNNILNKDEIKFRIIDTKNQRIRPLFLHKWTHNFLSKLGFVYIEPFYFIDNLSDTIRQNITNAIEFLNEDRPVFRQTSSPQQIFDPYSSSIKILIGHTQIPYESIIDSGNEGPICMTRKFYKSIIGQYALHSDPIPVPQDVHPLLHKIYSRLGHSFNPRNNLYETYKFLNEHKTDIKSFFRPIYSIEKLYEIIGCKFITGINGSLDSPLSEKIRLKFIINEKEIEMDVYILPEESKKKSSFDILFNVEFMHKMKEKKILPTYLPQYNIEFFENLNEIKKKLSIEILQSEILVSKKGQSKQILSKRFLIHKLQSQIKEITDILESMSSILVDDEYIQSLTFIDPYKAKIFYKINTYPETTLQTIFDTGNSAETIISEDGVYDIIWKNRTGPVPTKLPYDNKALPSEIKMINFILENIDKPLLDPLPITYQMIYEQLNTHKNDIKILVNNNDEILKLVYNLCGMKYLSGIRDDVELIIPKYVNLELKIPDTIDSLPIRALVQDRLPGNEKVLINIDVIRELAKRHIHLSFDSISRKLNSQYQKYYSRKRLEKIIDGVFTRFDSPLPSQILELQRILKRPSKFFKSS